MKVVSLSASPLIHVMFCAVGGGGDLALALSTTKILQSYGFRVCLIENSISFFSAQNLYYPVTDVLSKLKSSYSDIPIFTYETVPDSCKNPCFAICLPVIQNERMWAHICKKTSLYGVRVPILPIQMNCDNFFLPEGALALGFGMDARGRKSIGLCFKPSDAEPPTHETFLRSQPFDLEKLDNEWLKSRLSDDVNSKALLFIYNHLHFNSVRELLVMLSALSKDSRDVAAVLKTYDYSDKDQIPMSLLRSYDFDLKFFDQLAWYVEILSGLGISKVVFSSPGQEDREFEVSISGKTVYLLDPFPLSSQDFATLSESSIAVAGCTGLNSFTDAISSRKLPLYEVLWENRKLWADFCVEAKQCDPENSGLSKYFELLESLVKLVPFGGIKLLPYLSSGVRPSGYRDQIPAGVAGDDSSVESIRNARESILQIGEILRFPEVWSQWQKFSDYLINERNANKYILAILTSYLQVSLAERRD
ncbi:MAG: hypothetical protein EXS67_04360 [Candidatus Margulisbacteria bacterium]|nr:hypothetical protein [Candidatus Margulisiibacteriota bacterium]